MTDIAQAQPPAGMPTVIRLNADPLDWPRIPKPVKNKLRRLRRARDDAWLAWRAITDEQQEAWQAKRSIEARLKVLTGGRPDSPWYSVVQHSNFHRLENDHPNAVEQLEALDDAKANIERLNPIVDARSFQFDQLQRLVSSVERYLTEGLSSAGDAIKLHKGPAPTPRKGERAVDAVERCRRRLRELDADRHRATSAPWPSAEAKRRARAEIDKLAERGQPSALPLVESQDGTIYWPERPFVDVVTGGRLVSAAGDPRMLPLVIWLLRDTIVAKIEQQIDEIADDPNALTKEQREAQIREIDRDRLAIQREEEFWIEQAIDEGMTLLRRPDADARAIFGLADDLPAASPST